MSVAAKGLGADEFQDEKNDRLKQSVDSLTIRFPDFEPQSNLLIVLTVGFPEFCIE